MHDAVLIAVWVIYDSPFDFPDKYVARQWAAVRGKFAPVAMRAFVGDRTPGTLMTMREMFAAEGYACIGREADDDLNILETWM